MQTSKALNDFLAFDDRLGDPPDANPIVREDGIVYVKFDEIRISAAQIDGNIATFLWRGADMVYIRGQGYDAPKGQELCLAGFEGKIEIKLK